MVNSIDHLRFQMEETKKIIQEMQDASAMSVSYHGTMPQGDGVSQSAAVENNYAANRQYYDRNAESGDRLVMTSSAESGNLNYILCNDSAVAEYWSIATSPLGERNWGKLDTFEPLLAESWSVSDDKLTYHVKLRKGVLWHDFKDPVTGKEWRNKEVTADDFKFYLQVIQNEKVDASALRGYFADIADIKVLNKYEFDVIWKKKYFLSEEVTLGLIPLPEHLYHDYDGPFDGTKFNEDNERNKMIVGCGPYQFVDWKKGKCVTFKRFEKYFGRTLGIMPPIKNIRYELIQHPSTRFQALLARDVDEISLTPDQWIQNTDQPAFQKNGYLKKLKTQSQTFSYIGVNHKNPLFQDRRVRVALSHLINRKRIQRDIYHDLQIPVSGPMFAGSPFYNHKVQPYPFDVEKARSMLEDAGWNDSDGDGILEKNGLKFSFTVIYPGANPSYSKFLPILKEDMQKAGVEMNILSLEWSVILDRVDSKKFEAVVLGWSSPIMSDPYQLWHSDNANVNNSSNYISFANPEADAIINEIRQCFDSKRRLELYHEFHRLIHEEEPYLFLFSSSSLTAISSRYQNLREFPLGHQKMILWTPRENQMKMNDL